MCSSDLEMGSEDPTIYGFAPLEYVGTNFSDGSTRTDQCVTGFDNVGFVMGTSSSLFNTLITGVQGNTSSGWTQVLQSAIQGVLTAIGEADNDIADYPNPFYNYNDGANPVTADVQLTLVDGGEDGQNIPFHPLIQPYRYVKLTRLALLQSLTQSETWMSYLRSTHLRIATHHTQRKAALQIGL